MADDTPDDGAPGNNVQTNPVDYSSPKGGSYGGPYNPTNLDHNIRATMTGVRWTTAYGGSVAVTDLTYFFPASASDYDVAGYSAASLVTGGAFTTLSTLQQQAVGNALDQIESYTDLTFTPADSGLAADAALRFSNSTKTNTSEARFPSYPNDYVKNDTDAGSAGDVFLGPTGKIDPSWTSYFGTFEFSTIEHEIGHALGLKHGHDADPTGNGALAPAVNDLEFSIMTYASYIGADVTAGNMVQEGSNPRTYMMYDIAALQAYYGANWSEVGTTATYSWNSTSGLESIDGAPAPDSGATMSNAIFSTVWTEGATATYDLSNFSANQVDNMEPGAWLTFSPSQLAVLNVNTPTTTARGNVYNALLYQGNTASEIANLDAGSGNDVITGNDVDNIIHGNDGNDTIHGGGGNNTLYGDAGNDTLFGEGTTDTLLGGTGDDTYVILSAGSTIVEQLGEGTDTALIFVNDYTIGANVDVAYLGPGVTTVTGNDAGMIIAAHAGTGTTINGGAGNDMLYGADQDDTLYGGAGDDTLRGGGGNNTLYGGAGNDTLRGEGTTDMLAGGTGDDTYIITNIGSTIVEQPGEGNDTAYVFVNDYTIGANVETAYLGPGVTTVTGSDTGTTIVARAGAATTINGGAGNDMLYGADQDDTLYGGAGDDTLRGGGGNNTLYGGAGNDTLRGEGTTDTLVGGTGDDTYIITNIGSTIVEQPGEGNDTAYVFVNDYTIGTNVETAYLGPGVTTVTGNDTGMIIAARAGTATTINGGAGNDMLYGADQDDTLYGGAGDDTLRGGGGNNTLYGGAGNDTLRGEGTTDMLAGGTGDDTYIITNTGSTIVEQPGEGNDTAFVFVNDYTIGANVEAARLAPGVTTVTGNDTGMTITAHAGTAATINGGSGNDTLIGADQNDALRGGQGNDVLIGGAGNDTFAFARGDGNDIVHASSTDGRDIVAFDPGVAHDQLWFTQSNNDLVVSVIGENQAITVAGWFASTNNQVAEISAGDGLSTSAAGVNQLVQAMASFSAPPLGQTTLPTELGADLAPVLATNWGHG